MKIIMILFMILNFGISVPAKNKKNWLSIKVPQKKAEFFGKDIICTSGIEFSPAISSDNKVFYYVISNADYTDYKIVKRDVLKNGFGRIEYITLPSTKKEYSPFPKDDKLYYAKLDDKSGYSDIFYKIYRRNVFNKEVKLAGPVNTSYIEGFLSISSANTVCFESNRPGGFGKGDIYLAFYKNGKYSVENAGNIINSELNESDAFIANDESFIIVTVYNKKDSYGVSDLYISFKKNNKYTKLINMGAAVNSPGLEHNPHISSDGKFFFFSSNKKVKRNKGAGNGNFDIYWISTDIIKNLKQ